VLGVGWAGAVSAARLCFQPWQLRLLLTGHWSVPGCRTSSSLALGPEHLVAGNPVL